MEGGKGALPRNWKTPQIWTDRYMKGHEGKKSREGASRCKAALRDKCVGNMETHSGLVDPYDLGPGQWL